MDKMLQLNSAYKLHNVIVRNIVSKIEFITDVCVLEFNNYRLVYDLNNNNLQLGDNYSIKIDTKKTKHEIFIKGIEIKK